MLDFPDRGAPFRMTIWPGFVSRSVSTLRSRVGATTRSTLRAGRGVFEICHKPFEGSDRRLEPRCVRLVEIGKRSSDPRDALIAATQDKRLAVVRRLHADDPTVAHIGHASREPLCLENADRLRHRGCANLLGPRELPD